MSKIKAGAENRGGGHSFKLVSERVLRKFFGFTLAEVLITLAIIGVVAAITIPALITENQQRAWNTASNVFERRLDEALRIMNTQQILAGYKSTEDFVGELSKYIKIIKTCDYSKLQNCFSDKVYWGPDETEVDMTKIKTSAQFGLPDWDMKLVGVNFADGVNALIAYNPNCVQNPYSNTISVLECIAAVYDVTGYKKPNTSGKDLKSLNVPSLSGNCAFTIAGKCVTPVVASSGLSQQECQKLADEGLLKYCPCDDDAYAGAVKYCNDMGKKLPSRDDLNALAQDLYNTQNINNGWQSNLTRDEDKVMQYGLDSIYVAENREFFLWADTEADETNAYYRHFYTYAQYYQFHNGRKQKLGVICVDK